jgi:hypothetical protein
VWVLIFASTYSRTHILTYSRTDILTCDLALERCDALLHMSRWAGRALPGLRSHPGEAGRARRCRKAVRNGSRQSASLGRGLLALLFVLCESGKETSLSTVMSRIVRARNKRREP